ncbi:hypothetical protein DKX38_004182 [Salix brachista]|uniref:PPPDE domain-containing protein n=1 Tax=Salix brachista TaxID=2182728 RepID=A0A5N5NAN5_9ROSI|nr:hypothetical protein DKX38_004182 [Salix brachista]
MRLFPLSSSSSASSDKEQSNGGSSRVMLYLNIYDLTPINNYLYWFGLGIFHSGIEGLRLEGYEQMHHCYALLHLSPSNQETFPDQYELNMERRDAICSNTMAKMLTFRNGITKKIVLINISYFLASFRIHMIEDYLLDWIEASYMVGTDCLIADISYAGNQVITRQGYVKTTQAVPSDLSLSHLIIFDYHVHGMEYGFGAHEYPTSGVFEVEPRSCPGFIFRRSVLLGSTNMSRSEFQSFMEHLSAKYHGDTYHLIAKNCNHFTDEVCKQLTGKPIPGWINRMARLDFGLGSEAWSRWFEDKWTGMEVLIFPCLIEELLFEVSGSFCNCLLPESIQITAVRHLPDHPTFSDNDDDDDDQESDASSTTAGSEGEGSNHHLLTTPNGEVAFLKEKPTGKCVLAELFEYFCVLAYDDLASDFSGAFDFSRVSKEARIASS